MQSHQPSSDSRFFIHSFYCTQIATDNILKTLLIQAHEPSIFKNWEWSWRIESKIIEQMKILRTKVMVLKSMMILHCYFPRKSIAKTKGSAFASRVSFDPSIGRNKPILLLRFIHLNDGIIYPFFHVDGISSEVLILCGGMLVFHPHPHRHSDQYDYRGLFHWNVCVVKMLLRHTISWTFIHWWWCQ